LLDIFIKNIRQAQRIKRFGSLLDYLRNNIKNFGSMGVRLDKGEIVPNGTALHFDQGIAVTSHASQAKTVDQVIVSVPVRAFSRR
jgi:hypothetical protein